MRGCHCVGRDMRSQRIGAAIDAFLPFMRLRLLILSSALGWALIGVTPPPVSAQKRLCGAHGADTVTVRGDVRLYEGRGGVLFACRRGGRPVRLTDFSRDDGAQLAAYDIAGSRVAVALHGPYNSTNAGDPVHAVIRVANLRTRSVRSTLITDVGGVGPGFALRESTTVFLLRRQHYLANSPTRVMRWRPGAPPTPLAVGNDIDESSLAVGVRMAYWSRSGAPQSARIS
jgi:hypothetical protein